MPSTPPATNTSPSSALIARAAALIAASPDAQSRLNVTPATVTGKPARRAAIRATFRLSSPAWFAQPRYTSSTSAGWRPARRTTSPTTRAAREEGIRCRPRRFGPGPIGTAAADGGLPPEGGAGVRPTPGEDRGPDRGTYLHLEVRFIAGMVPIRAPLGPGNLYPLPALRRRVRLEERPFGGFARGRLSVGCRQCTDG